MTDRELARALAAKFHKGQMYGKHDYMYHLEKVESSVEQEHDDRLAIIALLHDILEDTDCTEELLRAIFDKDIVDAVVALTKREGEAYLDYIVRVCANALARIVKMHDSLCNLYESMCRRDMKRVIKYSNQINLLAK